MLPVLRTGEALVVGEAVSLPIRTLIDSPARDRRPDSIDPRVAVRGNIDEDGFEGPGGWNQKRDKPDYAAVVPDSGENRARDMNIKLREQM